MRRNYFIVGVVFLVFFVLSFLTNILGPIIPDIIDSFHVSMAAAAFLPFSFFLAYGVLSVPAGFLVDRFTEKPVMMASFVAALVGALSFAVHPTYWVAVASLFTIGAGMAMLQVAINPAAARGRRRGTLRLQFGVCAIRLRRGIVRQPADLFLHGEEPSHGGSPRAVAAA